MSDRSPDLAVVRRRLYQLWDPEVAEIWLDSPNGHLNGATPLHVLTEHGASGVYQAIEAEMLGVYVGPEPLAGWGNTMEERLAEGPDVGDMTESEMDDLSS